MAQQTWSRAAANGVLPFLVTTTVAAFAAALALILVGNGASPAAAAHVAFAMGIMPLIIGAMMHFVPVLTRGREPDARIRLLPYCFLAAGALAAAAFLLPEHFLAGIRLAVLSGLTFAAAMATWIAYRARATLGAPHPCLYWYLAAVLCLALALAAVFLMEFLPAQRAALRLFHLHLNLLGFIGLTALGTLVVLLPTAAGQPDPDAARRLRRDLPLAVAGVLLTSAGAAWWPLLAYAGLLVLVLPVASLGTAWVARFPRAILRVHGAAPSLALALAGLLMLLLSGPLHAQRRLEGNDAILGFLLAFLLPLVSGAVSQLLPLWLRPGVQTDWHRAARVTLGGFAVVRALTFVAAGWLVMSGWRPGAWLAAAALAVFASQLLRVILRR